jgi:hypothetical protein
MKQIEVNQYAMVEKVVIGGDLAALSPQERLSYYKQVCESVGLNPLTKPFEYIKLNNKLTLYAKRDATDQLRKIHGVSIKIVAREKVDELYIVTAQATDKSGRTDESVGAVSLGNLKGDAAANAIMKAETKAKRRVTLSIAGLGLLDETEISSIPSAEQVRIDVTGEIAPMDDSTAPGIPEDIKTRVHDSTLAALENNDATTMRQAWVGFSADDQVELWRMFSSAQRSRIKKLLGKE